MLMTNTFCNICLYNHRNSHPHTPLPCLVFNRKLLFTMTLFMAYVEPP